MANLDKLLQRVEKNSLGANETKTFPLKIIGETFDVVTMTRKEKRDFFYSRSAMKTDYNIGELIEWAKPYIYRGLQLQDLAVKAVEAKYIKKYHDVVDYLFEPDEIIEIIDFIMKINNISGTSVEEDIEEIKK